MTQNVELFYDFRSPYSYLAVTQLSGMDVTIDFRPIRILEVMEKVGNVPTTLTCAAKGRYARIDLGRWAKRYSVPLNPSDMKANDGNACACAVIAATTAEDKAAVTLALYRAMWGNGVALPGAAAIVQALSEAGIDATGIAERIDDQAILAQLDANTAEAVERGVFGSPSMFVGDAMFFGNDRMEFLREEIARLEEAA